MNREYTVRVYLVGGISYERNFTTRQAARRFIWRQEGFKNVLGADILPI